VQHTRCSIYTLRILCTRYSHLAYTVSFFLCLPRSLSLSHTHTRALSLSLSRARPLPIQTGAVEIGPKASGISFEAVSFSATGNNALQVMHGVTDVVVRGRV
jgi:hypothetical protein